MLSKHLTYNDRPLASRKDLVLPKDLWNVIAFTSPGVYWVLVRTCHSMHLGNAIKHFTRQVYKNRFFISTNGFNYSYSLKHVTYWALPNGDIHVNPHDANAPSLTDVDGNAAWYVHDQFHTSNDQPAVLLNGSKFWYTNGVLHRDNDMPAVHYGKAQKYWFKNGVNTRDGNRPSRIDNYSISWNTSEEYVCIAYHAMLNNPELLAWMDYGI